MRKLNKKGSIVQSGVMLATFIFLIILLPTIYIMVQQELRTTVSDTWGETSPVYVVADNGVNSTVKFSNQIPTSATIGGVVIIVLMVGFAIKSFMGRNKGGGSDEGSVLPGGGAYGG